MSKREASSQLALQPWLAPRLKPGTTKDPYALIRAINGLHPWQDAMPEGHIQYQVRELKNKGKLLYFNFALAKEMGLIADNHPLEITSALEKTLLETFCLQIINEYDIENKVKIPKENIKPHSYMATRYLQLQHANKQGKTSGDGRSIWNGCLKIKGKTWDISSRGTGVTRLAPGAVEACKHLKTGSEDFGYGCGLADIDELLGSAIMSEIFHKNGIPTERVLTIIDLGKGLGIGVRAGSNLLRPAHLFMFLKQKNYAALKRATDYLLERQIQNGEWHVSPRSPHKYRQMLGEVARSFAQFAAQLERQYIFAWLDWDGDNVLANAGIIDYGSIRQFGLRHDQYRYDDVHRYSTNLNEQRAKARLTVQVFAQLVDYLESGKCRPLHRFSKHPQLREFDQIFESTLRQTFLQQIGLQPTVAVRLLKKFPREVEKLYQDFSILERTKTKAKTIKVADGINRPAIYNMRAFLRELPKEWGAKGLLKETFYLTPDHCMEIMRSGFAKKYDLKLTRAFTKRVHNLQDSYRTVVRLAHSIEPASDFYETFLKQAQSENRAGRITGNSIEFLVDAILKAQKRGYTQEQIHQAMDLFVGHQAPARGSSRTRPVSLHSPAGQLYQKLVRLALDLEEEI